jgi:hypothetical protein
MSMKYAGNLVDSARSTRSLEAYLDEQLILAHPDRGCKAAKQDSCLKCNELVCRQDKRGVK